MDCFRTRRPITVVYFGDQEGRHLCPFQYSVVDLEIIIHYSFGSCCYITIFKISNQRKLDCWVLGAQPKNKKIGEALTRRLWWYHCQEPQTQQRWSTLLINYPYFWYFACCFLALAYTVDGISGTTYPCSDPTVDSTYGPSSTDLSPALVAYWWSYPWPLPGHPFLLSRWFSLYPDFPCTLPSSSTLLFAQP